MEQLPHQPPPSPLTIISSTTCICSSKSNTTDIARDFFLPRARECVCVKKQRRHGLDMNNLLLDACSMHNARLPVILTCAGVQMHPANRLYQA